MYILEIERTFHKNFLSSQTMKKQVIQVSALWMTELLNPWKRNVSHSGTSRITGNMTMKNVSNKQMYQHQRSQVTDFPMKISSILRLVGHMYAQIM